ncbi:MAG: hypothetical protein J7480_01715, partial [Microbacteriaceae bacterium]|nr:hypothetical protein [Microbacteriaceae bacterium]
MSDPTIAERATSRRHAAIGSRRIWLGTGLILAVQIVFDFSTTLQQLAEYPDVVPVFTAWAVLFIADVAATLVTRILGE